MISAFLSCLEEPAEVDVAVHSIQPILPASRNSVDAVLAVHDLADGVGGHLVAGVIHQNVVSAIPISQHPVTSVVHVANYDFACIEVAFDLTVRHLAYNVNNLLPVKVSPRPLTLAHTNRSPLM